MILYSACPPMPGVGRRVAFACPPSASPQAIAGRAQARTPVKRSEAGGFTARVKALDNQVLDLTGLLRVNCHPRTVYRDLEALQIAGFPIYTERVEGEGLTELMALYFSTDMLKVFKDTVFYDSLESLSQKIKTTLPPESHKYLQNVEQTLHVGIKPRKEYGKFKEIINRVNDAALNRKSLDMVYYTISRKKETRRKVDPYRLWFSNGTFYLIGYCHLRQEVRIFALDRIKMLHPARLA